MAMQALSGGMTDAAHYSLLAATAFLALGFIGALQVHRAAENQEQAEHSLELVIQGPRRAAAA